ncbi:ABC-three component system middle component 1 [Saccharococcus caldoxylosilyticus]|uniref:ABC-three component system middle component 1 n=1 Tax=Saccharococcus caldoxylosilyticus TaxID=81408 RepID=UPI00035E1A7A|nr:ABC-three component system middle component 1 [Parageobacillus caldoxylosilyticus]
MKKLRKVDHILEINVIRNILKNKGFTTINYSNELTKELTETLLNNGFEVWKDENRYVVIKEYQNDFHFLNYGKKDHIEILYLLNEIPSKYKNNLYFFLIIKNVESESDSFFLEKNRLEKDAFICRKYVIESKNDLLRIPFLNENFISRKEYFNYEEMFKDELLKINGIEETVFKAIETYFMNDKTSNLIKLLRVKTKDENK